MAAKDLLGGMPPVERFYSCQPTSPTCFDRSGLLYADLIDATCAMRVPTFSAAVPELASLSVPVPPSPMLHPPSPALALSSSSPVIMPTPKFDTLSLGFVNSLELALSSLNFDDSCCEVLNALFPPPHPPLAEAPTSVIVAQADALDDERRHRADDDADNSAGDASSS